MRRIRMQPQNMEHSTWPIRSVRLLASSLQAVPGSAGGGSLEGLGHWGHWGHQYGVEAPDMDGEENTKLEQGVINRQRRGHDMVQAWALIAASHGMHVLTGNKFCHGHSMQFDLANIMCLDMSQMNVPPKQILQARAQRALETWYPNLR